MVDTKDLLQDLVSGREQGAQLESPVSRPGAVDQLYSAAPVTATATAPHQEVTAPPAVPAVDRQTWIALLEAEAAQMFGNSDADIMDALGRRF
jgi:two-component system, NtrC family, nitrogen regulation response regulator GlnG